MVYGEVGWKPNEGVYQASGDYHVQELEIDTHHGVPLVGIYCHIADPGTPAYDFGLWITHDHGVTLEPRPAAVTVSAYLREL